MADTLIEISITRLQKGWSKPGGSNHGYTMSQDKSEWTCQACGLQQPSEITAYLFPFEEFDVVRICPQCQNITIKNDVDTFGELLDIVR